MAIRLAILAHHYRSDWEWTPEVLAAAAARLHPPRTAVSSATGSAWAPGVPSRRTTSCARSANASPKTWTPRRARRDRRLGRRGTGRPGIGPARRSRPYRDTADALLGVAL